jgi:hypothetical protein
MIPEVVRIASSFLRSHASTCGINAHSSRLMPLQLRLIPIQFGPVVRQVKAFWLRDPLFDGIDDYDLRAWSFGLEAHRCGDGRPLLNLSLFLLAVGNSLSLDAGRYR